MSGMVAKAFGRDRKNKTLTIDIETLGKTSSPMPPSPTTSSSPPTSVSSPASSTQDIKKPLVLVRGTKERPGFVQATVTLELDSSTEGDEVEIIFKAVVGSKVPSQGALWENESRSEQILQQKRWVMPVRKAGAKTIAAGIYRHQVFTTIDHSWPSSCTTQPEGFVQYMFQAQIMATTHAAPLLSTTQEFLVINHHPTTQPTPPSNSLYSWGRNHSSVVPHSTLVVSPKKSLPVQVSIPSETLMFGQGVPITIDVYPFKEDSSFAGQEAVIMEARFRIQEVRHARSSNHTIKDKLVKDVVELKVPGTFMGSWPQGRNGWKRTVTVKMPYSTLEPNPPSLPSVTSKRSSLSSTLSAVSTSSTGSSISNSSRSEKTRSSKKSQPFLRASLRSRYYDVTHQLLIGLKIRTSGEKDKQAEDVEIRLDFKLAYPQPDGADELPEYHPVAAFSFDGDDQQKSTRRETFAGKILQPLRI
ncbi:hypothetical protein BGX34_012001 [Mortierella sp. NVP85]|nr:hypothetical protein BGX34_012001 [Mortierella sp. NVP85]